MRIGILTLPPHANYGGILQAYALQTVLERMGHKVVVFNRPIEYKKRNLLRRILTYSKRIVKKYICRKRDIRIFEEKFRYKFEIANTKYTEEFVKTHINNYYVHSLLEIKNEFDVIVVGSDQVWRMKYFRAWGGRSVDAFLAFTKGWDIKRVAYAASFGQGKAEILQKDLIECKECIKKFDAISCREESGVNICKDTLDRDDAKWMLDPTLLLAVEDYAAVSSQYEEEALKNVGSLVKYVLDESPEKKELLIRISKEKNMYIYELKTHESDTSFDDCTRRPVEEWLQMFKHAGYVVTDSFHACVFSILNHKQFTVIANKARGIDRFESLLKLFGLQNRIISCPEEYKELPDIDYSKVDVILNQRRQEAFDFLESNLS